LTTEVKLPSADVRADSIASVEVRRLHIGCWFALILIAIARAWFTRYQLEADAMSYLDVARAVAGGHPGAAIHAYWSPGYPVLLSLFFRALHPNAYWEFPLVHFVNLLIFIAGLACFRLFWGEALRWHRQSADRPDSEISEDVFWALGYAAFGITTLNVITLALVGPDLLVSVFCCLAGWSMLRFRRSPSVGRSVLLGLVLAVGYYVKAPFFPMAFIFLLCASLWRPVSRRVVLLTGIALIVFLLVSAPLIAALSRATGRFTFGDSARVNQAFYIDGVQMFRHWQGGPPGSGMPLHPTHKLNEFPEVYEFAASNMGTYPPWFDPTYWNAGIRPHLILKREVVVFVRNVALEFQIIMESGAELVCVLVILALLCNYNRRWLEGLRRLWFVWVPGVIALIMFALVHVEPRFLGGWLVMLFAGGVTACALPAGAGVRRAVWCIGVGALVTAGAALVLQSSREAIGSDHAAGRSPEDALIAVAVLHSGLHAGDPVALIGDGTGSYWAHLAQLHIVAEVPASSASRPTHPALDFWESGPELQQKVLRILEGTGARAVIAGANPSIVDAVPSSVSGSWRRIGGTRVYIYFFPEKP
jgi:hypothetical protein